MPDTTHALTTPDGPMELFEATPDGEARGGVVVVQEAFGLNDHIREVARRFAAEGYHAVAPALFHRAGGGTADYGDFASVLPLFAGFSDDGILMDVDASLAHLHAAGVGDARIGVVGFCLGGRVSFLVAARREIGAGVGFYGGGIVTSPARMPQAPLIGEAATLRTPWLGLFGDDDHTIPVDDVEQLREALGAAPVPAEVVRYAGAGHAFNNDARDDMYAPEAAADARARTLAWLDQHLA